MSCANKELNGNINNKLAIFLIRDTCYLNRSEIRIRIKLSICWNQFISYCGIIAPEHYESGKISYAFKIAVKLNFKFHYDSGCSCNIKLKC